MLFTQHQKVERYERPPEAAPENRKELCRPIKAIREEYENPWTLAGGD
jgi:hypothetical protein